MVEVFEVYSFCGEGVLLRLEFGISGLRREFRDFRAARGGGSFYFVSRDVGCRCCFVLISYFFRLGIG